MIQTVAIGIIGVVLALTLRQTRPELALMVSLATGGLILILALGDLTNLVSFLTSLASRFGLDDGMIKAVLQMTGIAYLAEFGVQACKDAGEGSIAQKVELCGKVAIFLLCAPVVVEILSTLFGMVQL